MNNSNFKSLGKVHVYSFRDGYIHEYNGEVLHSEEDRSGRYYIKERTIVNLFSRSGEVMRYLTCSKNEGEIFNNILWLREADIEKAAWLFIDSVNCRIEELEDEITRHKHRIESLKQHIGGNK